jgi:hypothetical protein
MKTADFHRFLVVCVLVSDLYCPDYNPGHPLEKNSNLARTAARYKVHTPKIAAIVRLELSRKKDAQDRRQNSATEPEKSQRETTAKKN